MTEEQARKRAEALVIAMVGANLSGKWWLKTNRAFDGETPSAMWRKDWQRVYNYLMNYSGQIAT